MASLLDCGRKSTTYEAAIRLLHQVEPGLAAFSLDRVRHQAIEMLQECLNQRILLGSCITED
jgi:hypothetical protein